MRRPLATPACLLALTLAMFGAWMHWAVLDPSNIGWLLDGTDRGQNSLGLIAYLRARPPWPSLHDPLLMAPEGLALALTDSNPLLAILLRPVAGWLLPDRWQYAGLWLLSCVGLQVAFAWKLVRPFAADRGAALLATALLAGTPVLFARYGHLNLCAQWLILWALWVFVDARRSRRPGAWSAVVAVAWLVHPYLAVMVTAIWASAVLRWLVTDRRRWPHVLLGAAPVAVVAIGVPFLLGVLAEPLVSTGTYGAFSMALDALWNPGREGYSSLLPAASVSGAQGFEGMNYLGAGLLALALAAMLRPRRLAVPASAPEPDGLRCLWWLLPAFLVLAIVAVGPAPAWRGVPIVTLPLSPHWHDALDPLRASGRMFWPAYYTLVLVILATICRWRDARPMLAAAVLLQAIDLAPMLVVVHRITARADHGPVFARTRDPRWPALIAGASAVEVHPDEPYRDLALLEEVAWRAIAACRPVPLRYFYASREPRSVRARLAEDRRRLNAGILDPTRLYVLIDPPPAAVARRVVTIDGVSVIPPSAPGPAPACVSAASSPRSAS